MSNDACVSQPPGPSRKFHFIGIGGSGMSVIAELLAASGCEVSGSDQIDSPTLQRLNRGGITTYVGQYRAHVPRDATVVVSTAIRPTNPELMIAHERHQQILHRSQALNCAAGDMRFVAIAGAHGKTSTSAMLAISLRSLGIDASYAIGSSISALGSGGHLGTADIFVAEADESDGSFLNYAPSVAVVTNVEADHVDYYGSQEKFEDAFLRFAHRLSADGVLICCVDDPGCARLAHQASGQGIRVLTYGTSTAAGIELDASSPDMARVIISDVTLRADGSVATLHYQGSSYPLEIRVPGLHNVLNATGAWLAGIELGVAPPDMAQSLSSFLGTGRRFELRGQVGDRQIYDDYAHHPTEVAATLAQARVVAGDRPITVLFQPHLYSRVQNFANRFAEALSAADHVIVTDIFAAREDPIDGINSGNITEQILGSTWVPDLHDAAREAAKKTGTNGLLLTMGAGSITGVADDIVDYWEANAGAGTSGTSGTSGTPRE